MDDYLPTVYLSSLRLVYHFWLAAKPLLCRRQVQLDLLASGLAFVLSMAFVLSVTFVINMRRRISLQVHEYNRCLRLQTRQS